MRPFLSLLWLFPLGVMAAESLPVAPGRLPVPHVDRASNRAVPGIVIDHRPAASGLPGGAKKSTIRFDAPSDQYWSLVTPVLERHPQAGRPGGIRNTLALACSPDLTTWAVRWRSCLAASVMAVVEPGQRLDISASDIMMSR